MDNLFKRTFAENIILRQLEIRNLGKEKLSSEKLSVLFAVVNYRYENMLPTVTYTSLKSKELIKAISDGVENEVLAHAIVGRLWEMGVCRTVVGGVL